MIFGPIKCWPLWARRTFVALLPISGPIYLAISAVVLVIMAVITVGALAVSPFWLLFEFCRDAWRDSTESDGGERE